MKKSILVMLLVVLVVSAFAKTVTLNYWIWDPELRDKTQALIDKFEASHPNIKVELTTLEPKNYWTKLRIAASSKRLPDVFNMSSGYIEEWAKSGFLMNITDYVNKDINQEKFFKNLFDTGKDLVGDGNYYAIPFALVTTVLYYNKDMFDEAGLSYPNSDWTWFEFLRAAKRLTKDKDGDGEIDQWGYWFYGRYAHIESWIYRNGGSLLDRSKMRFAPDKNAVETLEFLDSLVKDFKVAPQPKQMSGIRQQDVFPRGLAAMWVDGSWNIENNRTIIKDKFRWGIAEVPLGPHGNPNVAYGWPDFVAISAFTKNKEAAWEFAKFASGEGLDLSMYMAGKIPSYKPLGLSKEFYEEDKQPSEKKLLLDIAAKTMKNSFTQGWGEWRGYGSSESMGLNGAIDGMLNGDYTLDEALKIAEKTANKVLERYYK
jgi:multiple sugar transport system substrate-binding protein